MKMSSNISGFYKLSPEKRLTIGKKFANLSEEECHLLLNTGSLPIDLADRMIENTIGAIAIPIGIGVNFLINDKNYLIPMATEEPSVVAAASYDAKMVREGGGFSTSSTDSIMIGQIQTVRIKQPEAAKLKVLEIASFATSSLVYGYQ